MAKQAVQKPFPRSATIAAIIAFVVLCALGSWQVQRLAWKTGLIATIEEGITANPVRLQDVEAGIELGYDVDWLRAQATGTFRHDLERHFYAQSGSTRGYHIVTPLETAQGLSIWVNRGFVPEALKEPATRATGQVSGAVEIVGLVRIHDGKPGWFVPGNDAAANVWLWWDLLEMTAGARPHIQGAVLPVALEMQGAAPAGGYPAPLDRQTVTLPNRHLGYALTWFGLALCLAGVYIAFRYSWKKRDTS